MGGHRIVGYDTDQEAVDATKRAGAKGASSLPELVELLATPRIVWSMLPAGEPTERTIDSLMPLLSQDDVIVNGGNCYYKDSMLSAEMARREGVHYLDVGISGGIAGLKEGYSLMVGGEEAIFQRLEPLFQTLAPAPDRGYDYVGPSGAGHFVKMVHNGIEYGVMQAYAEGFEILAAKKDFDLDLCRVGSIWQHGSVIRSRLLDFALEALSEDPKLQGIRGYVEDLGEGRWTVAESIDLDIAAPVITAALQRRLRSRQDQPFGDRLLAAMRNVFGGHAVRKAE
jgi:6-phosphogluconate dehydrogenase